MNIDEKKKECSENWIEHIVDKVNQYYAGRQVVLWGKYNVSDCIKNKLKEKYGIDVAFYVDSDNKKIDNMEVLPANSLNGKASEYYVVIPLAFYQSIKSKMNEEGYNSGIDYYYFSDCMLDQTEDYYEDAHGNKIIGKYQGLKFAFSGFGSVIEIGNNVHFQETTIYVHNGSKLKIGNGVHFLKTSIYVQNDSEIIIGSENRFQSSSIFENNFVKLEFGKEVNLNESDISLCDNTYFKVEQKSALQYVSLSIEKYSNVLMGENVNIFGEIYCKARWILLENVRLKIGDHSTFLRGKMCLFKNSFIEIGKEFSIWENYYIALDHDTSISIGNDCMFSYNIFIFSGDFHSIFDVESGKNINSTYEICENRKIDIGNHVWVGMRATVLYNTQICDGSIIGAASLVKGTIPNNCIAAGNPAKVIRKNVSWSRSNCTENIAECGYQYVNYTEI